MYYMFVYIYVRAQRHSVTAHTLVRTSAECPEDVLSEHVLQVTVLPMQN